MAQTMLDAALTYARKGWPVFPCNSRKEPLVSEGCYAATTTEQAIVDWWTKWPNANIGFSPGDLGWMVIDQDPGHKPEELANNIGPLPETKLKQKTPRGGFHLFYELDLDERVGNSIGKLAAHVDVRSSGGYVLLAPSKTDNGDYTWIAEGAPAFRTPAMLAAALKPTEKDQDRDNWIIEPDLPENVELALKWIKEKAEPAIKGGGGNNKAFASGAMMKTYGLSHEKAMEMLWEHWAPTCQPAWYNYETLERCVTNAYSYNQNPPGHITPAYRAAKQKQLFQPVTTKTDSGKHEETGGRFRIVNYQGILEIPPPEWLIKNTLTVGGYMILHGARSSYKSFVAMDIALSVATGFAAPSTWDVLSPGKVLYSASEGRSGIGKRVKAWSMARWGGDAVPAFYLGDPVPSIKTATEREGSNEIDDYIQLALRMSPNGYKLVILDTIGRAMAGMEENSSKDASQFTQFVTRVQNELGAAVIAIHHGEDKARGSTGFEADADAVIRASKDEELVCRLAMTKQKDDKEWGAEKVFRMTIEHGSLVPTLSVQAQAEAKPHTGPEEAAKLFVRKANLDVIDAAVKAVLAGNPAAKYTERELAEVLTVHPTVVGKGAEMLRKDLAKLRITENSYARQAAQPDGRYLVYRYVKG